MNLEWLDDESVLRSALLTELGEHVQALFEQICTFNCGIQLVRFLVEHEHMLATVAGIAFHLNEPPTKVESDLHALEKLRLVRQVDVDDLTLFGVTMDSSRRRLMRDLCTWQEHWHTRLARIGRAIDGKEAQEEYRGIYANG